MARNSIRRLVLAVLVPALALAFCGIAWAQTMPASPSPVNFLAADVYKNNGHPNQSGIAGLAFDDFNGDGTEDIVAVDGSNCVSFFPGDGKGLFGSPVDTCNLPSRNIYWAVSGDFNNDGVKDLAVVATNPGTITLMLLQGNGDGTFTYQNTITINHYGEQATDFKAADLNGDGKLDLVLTSTGSGSPGFYSTYVFLANGNFSFAQSQITGLGGCPYNHALVIADFNHDSRPDLAVSNSGCGLHEIDVMLGNGDGTFQSPVGYSSDVGAPSSIAAGDVNGDGKIDLVSVNAAGGTPLNVFIGNGDGTFGTPVDVPTVYDPDYVAVGDFNGDGKDDLIVSSDYGGEDHVDGVQLSTGGGNFTTPVQYSVLWQPTRIYVVDLNGDTRLDWVSISNGGEQFCVVLGTGTGGFPAAIDSFATPNDAGSTDAIVAADFNQDLKLDYATVGWDFYYPGVNISLGDGTGHFGVPVHYSAGNNPTALVAGNFNQDKFPDIAALDQSDGMVTVLLNNGDGTLGFPASYPVGAGGGYIQTGDFNRDGNLDLIVTNSGDGTVSVLLGNGDGTFKPQVVSNSQAGASYLAVADFNGDGIPDVAVTFYSDPDIDILLGNGDGSFQTPIPISTSGIPIVCGLAAGDFNNDGHADLALCAQLISNGTNGDGGVAIFLNNGSGGFLPPVSYPTVPVGLNGNPVTFGIPRIGDLNNDGNMDIVIPNQTAYTDGVNIGPAILLGRGDGTFVLNPGRPAITGPYEQDIALGDFNNDGLLDMVVQNFDPAEAFDTQSSTVTMLLGTSSTEVVLTGSPNPSTQGGSVTFSASVVTSFLGLPIPTGTITFQVGSMSVPVPMVNGAASYSTAALPVGTTIVKAAYSGDSNFIPVTSLAFSQNVTTGPLTIETSSLPGAVQNTSYNASVSATGGVQPYAFSLPSGSSLPSGLTISAAGAISGIPTAPGTTSFTVQAKDSSNPAQTTTAVLSITVASNLQITMSSLPNGVVGNSYSASVAATGGVPAYTFSLASGSSLPSGLSISAAGLLSGTPTASGSTSFTVQVQDSAVPSQTTSASFSITVTSGLAITTTSLPNGVQGGAYSASISAAGGVPSYSFSLASGSSLPGGLTISAAGVISGTPTAPGTTTFTAQAKDSSSPAQTTTAVLSITVASNLEITTATLQNGVVGNAYSATVVASGGNLPETFSLAGGSSLPAGLSLSASGVISGTPSTPGTNSFSVQVKDSSPTPQTATASLSITVTPALSITTTTLPNGVQGVLYSASVTAAGGVPSYTFSLASGSSLPSGLTISAAGVISGTPTAPNTTSFTLQVKDSSNPAQTATAVLSIMVASNLQITTTSLQNGVVRNAYSATVVASGGNLPETFSLAGGSSLPAGLSLSTSGGISGTPTAPGTTSFTVQVKDSSPTPQTATANLSIMVTPALSITTTSLPGAVLGAMYSASVSAAGGVPSYSFSLASGSSLPSGLTISPAGVISGTPSAPGATSFTLQAKDSSPTSQTATVVLSITVAANLQITTTTLQNGAVGGSYSVSVVATGGTPSYSFSLASGSSLPSGLMISAAGVISGTPTAPGTTSFTVQAKDSSPMPQTATAVLSITVTSGLTITTTTLPNGAEANRYSASVSAAGGSSPYTFSLASGSVLPSGLAISAAGAISGTPTAPGTTTFTLQVKDSSPTPQTATANLSITIGSILQIVATRLPQGVVGDAYTATLTGLGGNPPYTFSLASGSALPSGLSINAGGVISGKPTAAGTSTFTVQLKDSTSTPVTVTAKLSITVNSPLTFTTTSLPSINDANGTGIGFYSQVIYAQGGVGPFTFTVLSGTLPPGVTLPGLFSVPFGTEGISIGGFPATSDSGIYTFTVQVTDSLGDTATQQLSITVTPVLRITTTSLPNGVVGTPYNATVAATGGTAPYTFSIGTFFGLPAGLTMSSSGVVTGTPTATNFFSFFEAQVKDATGATATGFVNLTIAATAVPLQIATTSLPNGVVGTPYSASIAATGGVAPYTVSITGSLPGGLSMNSTGFITGSPLNAGVSNFTVHVRDSSPTPQRVSANLSIFVSTTPVTPLQITTTSLPNGGFGTAYTATVMATGGTAPYTFSATGLPAGLTMSGAGAIIGTPTTVGTFTVQVRAHDAETPAQTTMALVTITVTAPLLQITTTSLPNGVVGTAYVATVRATGGVAPYTFSANGLPTGLTMSNRGVITGKPLAAGSSFVAVQVQDAESPVQTATIYLPIAVAAPVPPLQVTTTSLPNGVNGWYYFAQVAASGGTAPYSYSVIGSLPSGLTMPSTGLISGTPSATGTSRFTLQVQDSSSPVKTARANLSIAIVAPLTITTATIPDAIAGTAYSATITATGGVGPYTFTASGLPTGLTISLAGRITGIATTTVPYFTVNVTDSSNPQLTASAIFNFTIVNKLVITTTSLPLAGTGDNYVNLIGVTGGLAPVAFSVTDGSLPPGLTIVSGTIQGTPTTIGTYTFTLVVTDASSPRQRATQRLTIRVIPGVKIVTTSLPAATIHTNYSANINVTGGTAPYQYAYTAVITINGNTTVGSGNVTVLPAGMSFTTNGSGILSIGGTPTGPAGTTSFIVTVSDANGLSYSQQFNLVVQQ